MTRKLFVKFQLKHYIIQSKRAHQSANFETFECWVKISQIHQLIFYSTSQFILKSYIALQYHDTTSLPFLDSNIIHLRQKKHIKVQIFSFLTTCMKTNQIPFVIFKATSQFSFKYSIIFQCHDTIPMEFSRQKIICIRQKEPIKVQFLRLSSAPMKLHPILHDIFKATRSRFINILCQSLVT